MAIARYTHYQTASPAVQTPTDPSFRPKLSPSFSGSWEAGLGVTWVPGRPLRVGPERTSPPPRTQAHIPHAIEPLLTLSFLSPCGIHTRNDLVNSCGCSSSQSHGRVTPSPVADDTKWSGHETRRPAGKVMVSDFEALKITSSISKREFKGRWGAWLSMYLKFGTGQARQRSTWRGVPAAPLSWSLSNTYSCLSWTPSLLSLKPEYRAH